MSLAKDRRGSFSFSGLTDFSFVPVENGWQGAHPASILMAPSGYRDSSSSALSFLTSLSKNLAELFFSYAYLHDPSMSNPATTSIPLFSKPRVLLVWKDGLKELGQMDMDEVLDKIRMEGTGNGQ